MQYNGKALGKAIKMNREEMGYTQSQLAELVDITYKHLQSLEAGNGKPSIDVLFNLAHALNLSVDKIFFPNQEQTNEMCAKIERKLTECSPRDLKIIYATLLAITSENSEGDQQ